MKLYASVQKIICKKKNQKYTNYTWREGEKGGEMGGGGGGGGGLTEKETKQGTINTGTEHTHNHSINS